MSMLARAITLALGSVVCATSAHAATYVVTAHQTRFDQKLAGEIEAAGGTITARLPQIGVVIVESDDPGFATRAGKVQGVRSAVADVTLQFEQPLPQQLDPDAFANPPDSGDDDGFFDLQWGHAAIDAAGAWNAGYRGEGATVAVLDSGLYCEHQEFADNLLAADSASFVPGESYCNSTGGSTHGTHTAGTILAGDNGVGTIGVAPEAKLIAVKVLSSVTGSGSFAGIMQGIVHAAERGADVINMSLGVRGGLPVGGAEVAELINATKRAVQYAASENALVVASAGNDGRDLDHDSGRICDDDGVCSSLNLRAFPAQLPGVVSVSATAPLAWAYDFDTNLDVPAHYTNSGQSSIDFAAPGGDFDYPGNEACTVKGTRIPCYGYDMVMSSTSGSTGYGWSAGTSMAAPHVSGVAALIVGRNGGEMSPAAVERILRETADDLGIPGNDDYFGKGRVNASRAVGN